MFFLPGCFPAKTSLAPDIGDSLSGLIFSAHINGLVAGEMRTGASFLCVRRLSEGQRLEIKQRCASAAMSELRPWSDQSDSVRWMEAEPSKEKA